MYPEDIERWIEEKYPNRTRAKAIIAPVAGLPLELSKDRIVRCVLYLSDGDYDALDKYVKAALRDPRDIIWYAEYDNRDCRVRDFEMSLYAQP